MSRPAPDRIRLARTLSHAAQEQTSLGWTMSPCFQAFFNGIGTSSPAITSVSGCVISRVAIRMGIDSIHHSFE